MAQWFKLPSAMLASHIGVPVLGALLPIQLPTKELGKADADGTSAWTPVTHRKDLAGAAGSFLWLGLGLAVTAV